MSDEQAYDLETLLLQLREIIEGARTMPMSASVLVNRDETLEIVEDALRALPGIGRYTAGAVLSFAYGRDAAVLDTNVRRVLGRVFLGPRRSARVRGDKAYWDLAAALVPAGRAYDFNQALMDFGATWCSPRRPRCRPCPMNSFCASAEIGDGGARQ